MANKTKQNSMVGANVRNETEIMKIIDHIFNNSRLTLQLSDNT
jgi:hypothetical protein